MLRICPTLAHLDSWFPAHPTAAACALRLRIVFDCKLTADELSDIVDSRAFHEIEGDRVDEYRDPISCFEVTAIGNDKHLLSTSAL